MTNVESRASVAEKIGIRGLSKPERTSKQPVSNVHKDWLYRVEEGWQLLRLGAMENLRVQGELVLNPEAITAENLSDKFEFKRSDIRLYVINMGSQSDIRAAFRFFDLGTPIETEDSRAQHVEEAYEVTRLQLFQTYIAVHALLSMSQIVGKRSRRLLRNQIVSKEATADESKVLFMLEKLMKQRPEKGGPLMTVKP